MPNSNPALTDRIKQLSRTTGTGPCCLEEIPDGFSEFSKFYTSGDVLFYAISDGDNYEVGLGAFIRDAIPKDFISRTTVYNSSNSNNLVDFPAGLKEVYVTYPGEKAVFSAFNTPVKSGIAVFDSNQILFTDNSFVINSSQNRMGVNTSDPSSTLDVNGLITSDGLILENYGIYFSGIDGSGEGFQKEPFMKNELNNDTGTDIVFSYSGLVNQALTFNKQPRTYILCGPSGGDPLSEDYPTFRQLRFDDVPEVSGFILGVSGWADSTITDTGVLVSGWADSTITDTGVLVSGWSDSTITDTGVLVSGWSDSTITDTGVLVSGWADSTIIDSDLAVSGWTRGTFENTGSGLSFVEDSLNTAGTGNFNQLQTNKESASQNYAQVVSDSGLSNTIVSESGFLTIPVFNTVIDVKDQIPASNTGVIAFASGNLTSQWIMIANGTNWVSGQLI